MTQGIAALPIQERFTHLLNIISSQRFLKMQGLGNEVPFFICSFSPDETNEMMRIKQMLINNLVQQGINVLDINIYDISMELCSEPGLWDRIIQIESTVEKDLFKELLQGILDTESHLVPAIVNKMQESTFDVMFISGVGEVFPYIRSHNILNNLQSKAKDKPTLMFFPGEYTHSIEGGASLDLFGRLHDDKYYRAFDIYHCEL